MRACYFGTYREEYARNQILIEGLRRAGVDVIECHERLWTGIEDRVEAASGGWLKPKFILRVLRTYRKLIQQYRKVGEYDILIVGYPGHFDVFLARLITLFNRKPLVWDVLNSIYLISLERGLQRKSAFTIRAIRLVEKIACTLPDLLVLDCAEFVRWFGETHEIDTHRFRLVNIGADERNFFPVEAKKDESCFKVIYYGTYIPNHGVESIVGAAQLTSADPAIQYDMIGTGPGVEKARQLAEQYGLTNLTFIEWLEREELRCRIAAADLVLGVFGTTRQVTLTNNNKIYEGYAMHKPVVSGETPALPDCLEHGTHLYLCQRGSPQSLAEAILNLKSDPDLCRRLADNGEKIFHEHFSVTQIGRQFAGHLEELLATRRKK